MDNKKSIFQAFSGVAERLDGLNWMMKLYEPPLKGLFPAAELVESVTKAMQPLIETQQKMLESLLEFGEGLRQTQFNSALQLASKFAELTAPVTRLLDGLVWLDDQKMADWALRNELDLLRSGEASEADWAETRKLLNLTNEGVVDLMVVLNREGWRAATNLQRYLFRAVRSEREKRRERERRPLLGAYSRERPERVDDADLKSLSVPSWAESYIDFKRKLTELLANRAIGEFVADRLQGLSYREIGEKHGWSPRETERQRKAAQREWRKLGYSSEPTVDTLLESADD